MGKIGIKVLILSLLILILTISDVLKFIGHVPLNVSADAPERNYGYNNELYRSQWYKYGEDSIWWVPSSRYASHYVCVKDNTSPLLIHNSTILTYRNGSLRLLQEDVLRMKNRQEDSLIMINNSETVGLYYRVYDTETNSYAGNSTSVILTGYENNELRTLYSDGYDHYFIGSNPNIPNYFYSPWYGVGINTTASTGYQHFYDRPIYTPHYGSSSSWNTAYTVQDVVVKLHPSAYNFDVGDMWINALGVTYMVSAPNDYIWVIDIPGSGGKVGRTIYKGESAVDTNYHPFSRWRMMVFPDNKSPFYYITQVPKFTTNNKKANAIIFEQSKGSQIIQSKGRYFPYSFEDGPVQDVSEPSGGSGSNARVKSLTMGQITSWEKRYGIKVDNDKYGRARAHDVVPWKLDQITNCKRGEVYRAYYTNWAFAVGQKKDIGGSYDGPTKEDIDKIKIDAGKLQGELNNNVGKIKDGVDSTDITNTGKTEGKLLDVNTDKPLTVLFTNIPMSGVVTTSEEDFKPELQISMKNNLYTLPFTVSTINGENSNESQMWDSYTNKSKLKTELFIYEIKDPTNIPNSFTEFISKPTSEFLVPKVDIVSESDKTKLNNFKIDKPGFYAIGVRVTSSQTGETKSGVVKVKVMFPDSYTGLPIENYMLTFVNDKTVEDIFKSDNHGLNLIEGSTNSIKVKGIYNSSTGHTAVGSGNSGLVVYDKNFNKVNISSPLINEKPVAKILEYKDGFLVLLKNEGLLFVELKPKEVTKVSGLTNEKGIDMIMDGNYLFIASDEGLHVGSLTENSDGTIEFKEKKVLDNSDIFGGSHKNISNVTKMHGKIAVTSDSAPEVVLVSKN